MQCFCCGTEMRSARKVKVRRLPELDLGSVDASNAAVRMAYEEQCTYRWGVICDRCYCILDNEIGYAEIEGEKFTLAGTSRRDKARQIDQVAYWKWQRREAKNLGIDLSEDEDFTSTRWCDA